MGVAANTSTLPRACEPLSSSHSPTLGILSNFYIAKTHRIKALWVLGAPHRAGDGDGDEQQWYVYGEQAARAVTAPAAREFITKRCGVQR